VKHPVDVETRVSAELSGFIERLVNDPEREEPPTLDGVRAALRELATDEAESAEMHPQERESVQIELDDLIEEYGGDMLAVSFIAAKASEDLSRIIEAASNDPALPDQPTLGAVREAMLVEGLTARLVGDGVIEADEDQTLLAEIDALIERNGPDAIAETFTRFE
jgi:hypothetical protein